MAIVERLLQENVEDEEAARYSGARMGLQAAVKGDFPIVKRRTSLMHY
jgi:hypothetical protein